MNTKQNVEEKIETLLKENSQFLDDASRLVSETNARLENKDLNYVDRMLLEKTLNTALTLRSEARVKLERIEELRDELDSKEFKIEKKKRVVLLKFTFAITCVIAIVYLLSYN